MPGHGSKKQHQRTKGNLRPSSSSHAAELLNSAGTAPTGFIGFGQAPKYVPASSSLDDMDTSLDPDFRMVLRKFTKRDATTKVKACQEFSDLCKEKTEECLKSVLPFWPRTFNKLVIDIDYRVREAIQQSMAVLAGRVGRNMAPYLKSMMGAWLLAQCDTYPTVSSAAQMSFQAAFPPVKQKEAAVYCKDKILEYVTENLVKHTPTTLSDPKQTEQEDMENKYNRVLASSFLALRKLLLSIGTEELTSLQEGLSTLLGDPKLWKHGKSKIVMVRSAMYSFLAGICQTRLEVVKTYTDKMSPFILHNLDEKDPTICSSMWEAVLSLVNFVPECWKFVNVQKAFWPKLKNVLDNGCHGNAVVIGPNLLPLLSKIPADLFADNNKFMEDFFTYFRQGLGSSTVQKSSSECGAVIKAFMECTQYVVKQQMDSSLSSYILLDQILFQELTHYQTTQFRLPSNFKEFADDKLKSNVLPVVQASLLETSSLLSTSPLYGMMGKILTGLETNQQGSQTVAAFWTSLAETTENRLFDLESTSDDLEKRIVYLVRCLYFPHTETKSKTRKVGFDTNTADDDYVKDDDRNVLIESDSVAKVELGEKGGEFVQNLILLSFKRARKQFSTKHLWMLADLLELNSSDKIVSMVIESCHGDVSPEGTLQYFVFEICIPWLREIQERSENNEDLIHLINIVCLFVPSLENESAVTLLNKLYESCFDTTSEKVLVKKLFVMSQSCASVKMWIEGDKFGEKWVERSRSLKKISMATECQGILDNSVEVLIEVLKTKQNGVFLVHEEYLMKVLAEIVSILEKLEGTENQDSPDTVIQFVSQAVLLFFTEYKDCIKSEIGSTVIRRLYQICAVNMYSITSESMDVAQTAWCEGITYSVQMTGGLIYDNSVLKQITDSTVTTIYTSVTSYDGLCTLFSNVKVLLDSVQSGLPNMDRENDVYKTICGNLIADIPVFVPKGMLEYQSIKGDYPSVPDCDHKFQIKTLFVSLYNCQLLQHVLVSASENMDSETSVDKMDRWTDSDLECLLKCIQGLTIVQGMLEVDPKMKSLSDVQHTLAELDEMIKVICQHLGKPGMEKLWKLAFRRSDENFHYVTCLGTVLSLMAGVWGADESLVLQLDPLMERCDALSSSTVRMLQSTVGYLSQADQLTLTQILTARILTLSPDDVFTSLGVISSLSVMTKLTSNLVTSYQDEVVQLLVGVIDQILVWKDATSNLLEYSCSATGNVFSVEVSRFLCALVQQVSTHLTDKHWDFIMCSIVTWNQELMDVSEEEMIKGKTPGLQCLLVGVLDLVSEVSDCLKVKVEANPDSYPPNLRTEWIEFFGESIFSSLLPFYVKFISIMQQRPLSGKDALVLGCVCEAASKAPPSFVLNHELPAKLIAGDTSPLPDNLQTLMNHMCPFLLARDYPVQLSAYFILSSVIDTIPGYDKEDKSFIMEASGGEEKDEETKKSPPSHLMRIIDRCQPVLEDFLCDIPVDVCETVAPDTLQFQHGFGYLLSWRLLLQFFGSAPSELRQEYAGHLREFGYVEFMVKNLFKLMPESNRKMFETQFSPSIKGGSADLQHMSCDLYQMALKTIPAMVRQWWFDQDRKTSAFVDSFTTKYVSLSLCTTELQSVQNRDTNMEDMKIRTRPMAREVIATYGIEEVSVEIVIALPVNYPLGNISVTSEKRVGVSGAQWEKWLLQLNIFLTHQNGNIIDGLKLWRDNISKKFEGVEECMICFYVLHGTNFQLPRITCRTCKKKFHSACLYKWFNTSHNCTCPLCRNIF